MARPAKQALQSKPSLSLAEEINNELGMIIAECNLLQNSIDTDDEIGFRRIRAIKTSARRIAEWLSDSGLASNQVQRSEGRKITIRAFRRSGTP
jgi:hypothetical protein